MLLPAPCLDDSLACACATTSPNIVPLDDDRFDLLDIPLAGDPTRELSDCPSHRDSSIYDRRTGESRPIRSQAYYHSEPAPQTLDHDREGKPVTVDEFLQDMTSKVGRRYGRKIRLATVDLGAYCPASSSGNLDRSRTPTGATPRHVQAEVETRNDPHPRIQSRRVARRAPLHPRRKKPSTKSLAQRLFEADVFSSGTTPPRPATDASVPSRIPAHTSTRRPLQFVTSLNLVTPLESRIRNRRKGVREGARRDHDGSGAPAAQVDPEELVLGASTNDSAQGASPNRLAPAAVATSDHYSSSRNRNKATTQRARTGGSATALAPGRRRAQTRARGGKQRTARLRPKPFEYVPLPLVWVKNAARTCLCSRPCQGPHACVKTNFNFN